MTTERLTAQEIVTRLVRIAADYSQKNPDALYDFNLEIQNVKPLSILKDVPGFDRLVWDKRISGKSPTVRGTWVTAQSIVYDIIDGYTWADILRRHQELSENDIRQALMWNVENQTLSPPPLEEVPLLYPEAIKHAVEGQLVHFQYHGRLRVGHIIRQNHNSETVMVLEYSDPERPRPKWFKWYEMQNTCLIREVPDPL